MTATDPLSGALVDAVQRAADQIAAASGPRAYTAAEVAERLGVTEETVRRLVRRGHLKPVPHIARIRIAAAELEAYMRGER